MNSSINNNLAADDSANYLHEIKPNREDKILDSCRKLLTVILEDYTGPVAIRLWNNEVVIGDDSAACTLVFRKAYPLQELFLRKDLNRLAEAHLCGDVDAEGEVELFFDLVDYLLNRELTPVEHIRIFQLIAMMPNSRKKNGSPFQKIGAARDGNSKGSIAHHYDIGNEFYRLFLDPEMVYSCAYFSDPEQSLADAQRDKLDYICRKLRLAPGQKLLDIGCGWGGLALWAARNYRVEVHGITLSQEQYNYAVARSQDLKLDKRIKFELRDYRELPNDIHYDRIVSVGMFEHIGIDNFPIYFNAIKKLLKPDGLFLNHGITNDAEWGDTPITRFMNKYIFPDGELARIGTVINAMEDAGLEILDTEALRPHYVFTLRHWIKNLAASKEKAIRAAGNATYRLWRLYMAGSAYYFNHGSTGLYQVLACNNRQPWPLPLRRDGLYANH